MCGSKKFEFGYETLALWKVDARGVANNVDPDRGRILAFVECMDVTITPRIRIHQTLSLVSCSIFQYQLDHWNLNRRFIYR
jgi:hypothetical protein